MRSIKKENNKKKNCYNCIHLEYWEPDYEEFESAGFFCNKRESNDEHLEQLDTDAYRMRSKKCCELGEK